MQYPETYAEIDLDALAHNIAQMKKLLGKSQILAVLKANAYGHGARQIFLSLCECGVERFATANFNEAMELRRLDKDAFILILGYVAPRNIREASENNLAFSVYSQEHWHEIEAHAAKPVTVHIKVNTGFNRLGFDHCEQAFECLKSITESPLARVEGIYSHVALTSRDEDKKQMDRFEEFVSECEARGMSFELKHIADSICAVSYEWSRLDMVRLGAIMYGLKADRPEYGALDLRPTMRFCSSVSQVRQIKKGEGVSYDYAFTAPEDMTVATMCFGYADGAPRRIGGAGHVVINGRKAPLIGLMCMDQCMADLRGIDGVKPGDQVVIYDIDERSDASIYDMATLLKTNKNDIIAALSGRVGRLYRQNGREWLDVALERGQAL